MLNKHYQPKDIEAEAQQFWQHEQSFQVKEEVNREKYYCLSMLPYPSGELHVGHVRNYTIGDVIARYQRMLGKNVLQPMGWDAFGLPAENAAIKNKVPPAQWTFRNIQTMREQLKAMGFAIDWKREVATCEPSYYRWEQWLFIQLYQRGLVYRKNAYVNWDPVDQTVLSNEQVVNGRGWRSGAVIERREMPQWFLRITAYADELLDKLDELEGWPEEVKTMQRNWIGRSHGAQIQFFVPEANQTLSAFTTRPDTLMGVTYLALAPEHPLAQYAGQHDDTVHDFIEACHHRKVTEAELASIEKAGVPTGYHAQHPLTGEHIPIYVANYVLMEYGEGVVMAVPAHDQRDFEFAHQMQLSIKPVVTPIDGSKWDFNESAFTTHEGYLINSGEFDGQTTDTAHEAIVHKLQELGLGAPNINYRLKDWGVSRQRYWGAPIPMIYCTHCGIIPVPEKDLPVELPTDLVPEGQASPLSKTQAFCETTCPQCGQQAQRETDTFDTFMESSWYYLRYTSFNQHKAMLDDRANYWTPVDQYIGGIEHAVLHLLYSRFMHKVLRDMGLINSDEPFKRLLTQGMVLNEGAKMSKSKGNVVSPQQLLERFGADTVRLFIVFAAPPEQNLDWSDSGIEGVHRFIKRVWNLAYQQQQLIQPKQAYDWQQASNTIHDCRRRVHEQIRQAHIDMERYHHNTVAAAAMKIANTMQSAPVDQPGSSAFFTESFNLLLRLLTPMTPHVCHHLWRELGYGHDVSLAEWPRPDYKALKSETIKMAVQVNGKRRAEITVPTDADEETIKKLALDHSKVQQHLGEHPCKKLIVVPQRLVNIVL